MAMAYKGSLVELPLFGTYWAYEQVTLQFGQSPCSPVQSRMSRTSTFWLACTEYRLVPYSPACDLRTLGSTYSVPDQYVSRTFLLSATGIIQVSPSIPPFYFKFCSSLLRLRSVRTQSHLCSFPAMILYLSDAKQGIPC